MTTKITTVRLACDGCGATRQGRIGEKVAALREALKTVGWESSAVNNIDGCPSCRTGARLPLATEIRLVR